jgi:hypothetical protein
MKVRENTKSQLLIKIMNDNKDKPMSEVVKIMTTYSHPKYSWDEQSARNWYRDFVKRGAAPGNIQRKSA